MFNKNILMALVIGLSIASTTAVFAEETAVNVNLLNTSGVGQGIGSITLRDSPYGLLLIPDLTNLSPGNHGFHIHENPDCGAQRKEGRLVPGLAAGGHFDPWSTGSHEGPYGEGHLGDLPPLFVDEEGNATTTVLAPRLKRSYLRQRSIMIHMKGDNFSDTPAKLGGGGARLACGVIP